MKVVIIGASHGGLQAALALKRLDPSTEVLLIEKRTEISFISSGIILKMNGMVDELDQVRYLTSEELEEKGINIFLNTAVTALDPERKTVIFESQDGQKSELSYDKLILATGSNQFSTNLTLPSEDKVTMYKSYPSSVNALANLEKAQSISIVGGGYIGRSCVMR